MEREGEGGWGRGDKAKQILLSYLKYSNSNGEFSARQSSHFRSIPDHHPSITRLKFQTHFIVFTLLFDLIGSTGQCETGPVTP